MRVAVLAESPSSKTDAIINALHARGHDVISAPDLDQFMQGNRQTIKKSIDGAIVRDVYHLTANTWRQAVLLHTAGVPVVESPLTLMKAYDKTLSTACFAQAGLPSVPSVLLHPWTPAQSLPFDGPWVIKPVTGEQSNGVRIVHDVVDIWQTLRASRSDMLLSKWVNELVNWRVICTQHDVIGSYVRVPPAPGIITAVSLGAHREQRTLPDEVAQLACAMTTALQGCVLGVDIMQDAAGALWALEANSFLGWDEHNTALTDGLLQAWLQALSTT